MLTKDRRPENATLRELLDETRSCISQAIENGEYSATIIIWRFVPRDVRKAYKLKMKKELGYLGYLATGMTWKALFTSDGDYSGRVGFVRLRAKTPDQSRGRAEILHDAKAVVKHFFVKFFVSTENSQFPKLEHPFARHDPLLNLCHYWTVSTIKK